MPKEFKPGCKKPDLGTGPEPAVGEAPESAPVKKEGRSMAKVGKPAPGFSAPAFYQGKFSQVDLSEYAGRWVLLCFYPGDFTFV